MDSTEIQGKIRKYYEQLHANKLDNLEETDTFLETYNLPRLSWEEKKSELTDYHQWNRISNQKLPKKQRNPGLEDFIAEFYQTCLLYTSDAADE